MTEWITTETTLASPLTLLLEEEQHGDRQAEEMLFLSFTADLGFFETFALGVAQACGARVTVVGDAAISTQDPRAVRRAGRSYLPGHAACAGAFHPKVAVILGPTRVTVAIGSGNVTLAGWQANSELWTVLRGDTDSCPAVLADLAAWLRDLPETVRFSARVPDALLRAAAGIDKLLETTTEQTDTGVRLVSTSAGPILEQLPNGPVDELTVCAPFHDPGAGALRALVERLRPGWLLVSYQPELTELDGPAIAELSASVETEFRTDGEARYRHGKLVEWVAGGQRYALTGSPNLSGAALLRGLDRGGNCELGVVTRVDASLLPEGTPVLPSTVRATQFTPRSREDSDGPLLLGATRVEQGLHVLFTRALPADGYLELSQATDPPETWKHVEDVPSETVEIILPVTAEGGSRLRLVTTSGNGIPRYSNLVFVVDPVRAIRRPGITSAHTPTTRPDQLFEDPRLADKFFDDLTKLRSALPSPSPKASASKSTEGKTQATASLDRHPDDWESYLNECAGRVGHPLLRFALGLPALPGKAQTDAQALVPVSWDEQFTDDAETGLDADDAETHAEEHADEAVPMAPVLPDLSQANDAARQRYRRWARRLAEATPQLNPPERMLATRLLLWTAAAGAWDWDDLAWVKLLSDTLTALSGTDLPAEVESRVASLAAVSLAVLRAHAPRYERTQATIAYDRAADAVVYLLPDTDPVYVDEYSQALESFGSAVDPENVQNLAEEVVQADPIDEAVWTLAEIERDAHRHGNRLLHVTGQFANPLMVALEAVGAAQEADLVGAWATSTNGRWALCAWRPPDLITIDASHDRPHWRHYRLSRRLPPRALAVQKSFDGARTVPHGPFLQSFPEALNLLEELGLSQPDPPTDCAD